MLWWCQCKDEGVRLSYEHPENLVLDCSLPGFMDRLGELELVFSCSSSFLVRHLLGGKGGGLEPRRSGIMVRVIIPKAGGCLTPGLASLAPAFSRQVKKREEGKCRLKATRSQVYGTEPFSYTPGMS